MNINALLMDAKDNVVTCVTDVAQGEAVRFRRGDEVVSLAALEPIPYCHKIALCDLPEGADIVKYGESLGVTTAPVKKGGWVAHHNLVSVPRDYESEMIPL